MKICPFCNQEIRGNHNIYANHIRWCKQNPKYHSILSATKSKISTAKSIAKVFTVQCVVCGCSFDIKCTDKAFQKGKYRKTCSNTCAHKLSVLNCDIDSKNKSISESISNLTKTTNVEKICEHCGKLFITHKNKQRFCTPRCGCLHRYKYTSITKNIKNRYRNLCRFQFDLKMFPMEFDFTLVEQNGWYSAKNRGNNLTGVSRDHIYSCLDGYKNGIDPYIISHPANCRLMLHNNNSSKCSRSDINLTDLLNRIRHWNLKYGEWKNLINYKELEDIGFEILVKY